MFSGQAKMTETGGNGWCHPSTMDGLEPEKGALSEMKDTLVTIRVDAMPAAQASVSGANRVCEITFTADRYYSFPDPPKKVTLTLTQGGGSPFLSLDLSSFTLTSSGGGTCQQRRCS